MSKISKWKLEKTKVKVVFRLQFHATHIPQSGWDKLFISFIPADSGKTTAKTTKANVRNGTCKWADPIYETTRLLQDFKTKQYDEKLYKIVMAMGSSRASTLGEATLNLADYVDALKPSAISLPLHGCNCGTILHITIQLLTSKTGFREFEQQRELREGGLLQQGVNSHEISSLDEDVNLNEECSSNTSESLYAEKHEIFSTHDIDSLKSHTGKNSIDNELAMASEENSRLRGSLELAEKSIANLKLEVASLQSMANEVGNETQKLSHLLAAEVSSSEQLAKEVSLMKLECLKFKDDIVKLKDLKFSPQIPITETSNNRVDHMVRNGLGLHLCQPESVILNMTSPVSGVNVIDAMKGQIFDLVRELDEARVEKEALTRKMDQMECYYEALIQEIEETLSASRDETESVCKDMNEQMLRFVDERNDLEAINKELEKRATTSEGALRRARLNYSIAVDKLQKDLELLSSQVMSLFETNENLIKQALPSQSHLNRDLNEELYQKVEQELLEMYCVNLGLDIYSKALQESLCETNDVMGIMKEKIGELGDELKLSTASQNKLMVRLQKATDDIHTLSEFKSSSISQCSGMALQNQLLEDKLVKHDAYDRIKAELECPLLSLECCKEEKGKLEDLLVEFEAQKSQLENELTSIKGDFGNLPKN